MKTLDRQPMAPPAVRSKASMPSATSPKRRTLLVLTIVVLGLGAGACTAESTPWEEHGRARYGNLDVLQAPEIDLERVIVAYNQTYETSEREWVAPDDCAEASEAAQKAIESFGAMMTLGRSGSGLASRFTGQALAIGSWKQDNGCPPASSP